MRKRKRTNRLNLKEQLSKNEKRQTVTTKKNEDSQHVCDNVIFFLFTFFLIFRFNLL
jgi:hypothetical protein